MRRGPPSGPVTAHARRRDRACAVGPAGPGRIVASWQLARGADRIGDLADGDAGMWGLADLFESFPAGARPYPDV